MNRAPTPGKGRSPLSIIVQTLAGTTPHPVSLPLVLRVLSPIGKSDLGVKLTAHFYQVQYHGHENVVL
jgi:hypothetical protein